MRFLSSLKSVSFLITSFCLTFASPMLRAEEPEAKKEVAETAKPTEISLADGKLILKAPASWEKVKPRFPGLIEAEFAVSEGKDDDSPARLTMMAASGSVDANLSRWIGQFKDLEKDADGKEPTAKKNTYSGLTVHTVDLSGTYLDKPFPQSPKSTEKKDYRMLGAIIETDGGGTYFIKFYGKKDTLAKESEAFQKMLKELEWKDKK